MSQPPPPSSDDPVAHQPLVRVIKGDPTDEELAALVAVVAGLGGARADGPADVRRSEWSAHTRKVRGIHQHGPGVWRSSALPR